MRGVLACRQAAKPCGFRAPPIPTAEIGLACKDGACRPRKKFKKLNLTGRLVYKLVLEEGVITR